MKCFVPLGIILLLFTSGQKTVFFNLSIKLPQHHVLLNVKRSCSSVFNLELIVGKLQHLLLKLLGFYSFFREEWCDALR